MPIFFYVQDRKTLDQVQSLQDRVHYTIRFQNHLQRLLSQAKDSRTAPYDTTTDYDNLCTILHFVSPPSQATRFCET